MASEQHASGATAPYPQIYRDLMAVSLLGTTRGLHADADIAAAAVELTLADGGAFRVCRAIAHGIAGETGYATRLLQDESTDDAQRVAMASALLLAGDPAWRGVIDGVLARSADQPVREAANGVLAFAESMA